MLKLLRNKNFEEGTETEKNAAEECGHFAYKRSLLFYTEDCEHCRYAMHVKQADGSRDCVCTYVATDLQNA